MKNRNKTDRDAGKPGKHGHHYLLLLKNLMGLPLCLCVLDPVIFITMISHHQHNINDTGGQLKLGNFMTNTEASPKRTLHIIQCLSGNNTEFITEWEFGLKSILVNAPLDSNLHIHILADMNAEIEIDRSIKAHDLLGSFWRNKISVIVHNVELMLPSWSVFLAEALTNETGKEWIDKKVGIGGYMRLLAHRIIVPYECPKLKCSNFKKRDLKEALYMDTDVVIIANLNHLMQTISKVIAKAKTERRPRPLWIWNQNSGFMVMDLMRFESVWELAETIPNIIKHNDEIKKGDQWLLKKVQDNLPNQNATAIMPNVWSTHTGHDGFRRNPQNLYTARKGGTGMLHFTAPQNFGGHFMVFGGTQKWCKFSSSCNHTDTSPGGDMDRVLSSWGLAEYYAKLSWDWAIYQGGTSRINPGNQGHKFNYFRRLLDPDSSSNPLTIDLS